MVKIKIFGLKFTLLQKKFFRKVTDFIEASFLIWSCDNIFQLCFFVFKKSILVGGRFGEGVGGQEKCRMDALSEKKNKTTIFKFP